MARQSSTFLEAEDEEDRQRRLERLLACQSRSPTIGPVLPTFSPPGALRTHAVPPPTDLLARLEAFLPAIKKANEELAQRDPSSIDIENLGDEDDSSDSEGDDNHNDDSAERVPRKPYIEMDLGLGVFEARGQKPPPGSNPPDITDDDSEDSPDTTSSGEDESESDPDVDMDGAEASTSSHNLAPITTSDPQAELLKMLQDPPGQRPRIVVLSERTAPLASTAEPKK